MSAALTASTLATTPVQAAIRTRMERSVFLNNIHTGESLKTVYWHDGRYQPNAMRQINHILRDHYSGDIHQMDPQVADLLCVLHNRLGTHKPLQIVSGYRSPHTNAMLASMTDGVAAHSLHMEGKAVDIRIEGMQVRTIGRAAKSLRLGGVGQYPSSNFVHVDVGRVRTW
ncbi:MAG TPA: DUF882 domain-containing protein [Patescibacteria group bacterium]|nr:DUF882 domain-containing protein [Patescibacteria group bacterium]